MFTILENIQPSRFGKSTNKALHLMTFAYVIHNSHSIMHWISLSIAKKKRLFSPIQ